MADQTETLKRLNKEKDYEDKLAEDLTNYFIYSLDSIDLKDEERKKLKESLEIISSESRKHSHMFSQLIQSIVENGEDNY
jgi:ferritin-like protein